MIIKALFEGKYCRDWNVTAVNRGGAAEETVWSWVIIEVVPGAITYGRLSQLLL